MQARPAGRQAMARPWACPAIPAGIPARTPGSAVRAANTECVLTAEPMLRLSQWLPALRYSQSGTRIGTFGLARYTNARPGQHVMRTAARGCTEPPIRADGVATGLRCRYASGMPHCPDRGCHQLEMRSQRRSPAASPSRAAAIASAAATLSGFSRTRRNIPVAYGAYRDAVAGRERSADAAKPAARDGPGAGRRRRRGRESRPADDLICSVRAAPLLPGRPGARHGPCLAQGHAAARPRDAGRRPASHRTGPESCHRPRGQRRGRRRPDPYPARTTRRRLPRRLR